MNVNYSCLLELELNFELVHERCELVQHCQLVGLDVQMLCLKWLEPTIVSSHDKIETLHWTTTYILPSNHHCKSEYDKNTKENKNVFISGNRFFNSFNSVYKISIYFCYRVLLFSPQIIPTMIEISLPFQVFKYALDTLLNIISCYYTCCTYRLTSDCW